METIKLVTHEIIRCGLQTVLRFALSLAVRNILHNNQRCRGCRSDRISVHRKFFGCGTMPLRQNTLCRPMSDHFSTSLIRIRSRLAWKQATGCNCDATSRVDALWIRERLTVRRHSIHGDWRPRQCRYCFQRPRTIRFHVFFFNFHGENVNCYFSEMTCQKVVFGNFAVNLQTDYSFAETSEQRPFAKICQMLRL